MGSRRKDQFRTAVLVTVVHHIFCSVRFLLDGRLVRNGISAYWFQSAGNLTFRTTCPMFGAFHVASAYSINFMCTLSVQCNDNKDDESTPYCWCRYPGPLIINNLCFDVLDSVSLCSCNQPKAFSPLQCRCFPDRLQSKCFRLHPIYPFPTRLAT